MPKPPPTANDEIVNAMGTQVPRRSHQPADRAEALAAAWEQLRELDDILADAAVATTRIQGMELARPGATRASSSSVG